MNINDCNNNINIEQFMQFVVMTEMLKQSSGDSSAFQVALGSILNAVNDNGGKIDLNMLGLGESDLSQLGFGGGERIQRIYNDVKSSIKSGNTNIEDAVNRASRKYGIDKDLIMAVIKQESDFNPKVVSHAGAMGLMQLMPENCEELGVNNPFDIEENVDAGTRHLKDMLQRYSYSKELALAGYNAGPGTLRRRGVNSVDKISRLPYETRDYVKKVMKYYGK